MRTALRFAAISIAGAIIFVLGFAAGGEYRRYQINKRLAAVNAFSLPSARSIPFGAYHQQRIEFWRAYPADAELVMIGDSLTESGLWPELLPGVSVANRGVAGDRSAAMLADLDVLLGRGCRTVSLLLGTNDLLLGKSKVEDVFRTWEAIMTQLADRGIRVLATSTPLTVDPAVNRTIQAFNARIETACRSGSCTFIDLNTAVASDGVLDRRFTLDGVHLTLDAYRIWADLLRPHLAVDAGTTGAGASASENGASR